MWLILYTCLVKDKNFIVIDYSIDNDSKIKRYKVHFYNIY